MTTSKIYLTAFPANEGARRLAWLLCDREARARAQLRRRFVSDMMIHRLIIGDVTPGMDLGTAIHLVSEGAITARHWNSPAEAGWFDRPQDWPCLAAPEPMRVAA